MSVATGRSTLEEAATILQFGVPGHKGPGIHHSEEVVAARKAMTDLLTRCRDRDFTRDEDRLFRRYHSIVAAGDEEMVAAAEAWRTSVT